MDEFTGSEFDYIPPIQEEYVLADECGYVVEKKGGRILFKNRGQMPYLHLSWFLGVTSIIFLLTAAVFVFVPYSDETEDYSIPHIAVTSSLFIVTGIPAILCIRTFLRRRRIPSDRSTVNYVADLQSGVFTNENGKLLCSLGEIKIKKKNAIDNYLSAGDDTYYEKIIFKWGIGKRACIFKSTTRLMAEELIERLESELFGV